MALALAGCTATPALPSGTRAESGMPSPFSAATAPESITHRGNGDFTFEGSGGLAGRSLHVWYNAPDGDLANAKILIVMTGTQRDGESYRADWVPLLKGKDTLVLVPEFSEDEFPGVASYNLGNLVDDDHHPLPPSAWSFNLIEALFSHVVDDIHSNATGYTLFGHSAGAQFVHRFIEFMPHTRATVAVAANAGWYTVPDEDIRFPYGLKGAPLDRDGLTVAFARRLVILLGADDIDPHDSSLQRDRHTDAQGTNRLARGLNFYSRARQAAGDSRAFNWRLVVVPGIAHSHEEMAKAALPLLSGR